MTDLQGLLRFKNKIQEASKITNQNLSLAIANKAKEIAEKNYTDSPKVDFTVSKIGKNKTRLTASGEEVSFSEYGTGFAGIGTYPGELPTDPIQFESAGETHTTQGWEYLYPNEKTKRPKDDPTYWYYAGEKTMGKEANAFMYKTAKELRDGKAAEVVKKIYHEKLRK